MDPLSRTRAFFAALVENDWATMRQLLHPDATLESWFAGGRPVPAHTVLTIASLSKTAEHETVTTSFQLVDFVTVLVTGFNRLGDETWPAAWLISHRHDLIIRSRLFESVDDALTAFNAQAQISNGEPPYVEYRGALRPSPARSSPARNED